MAAPRFELYENSGWHWRLIDVHGRILASSPRFTSKANAKKGAQAAKDAAASAAIVDAHPGVVVSAVAGTAFGASVNVAIQDIGPLTSPPAPSITLAATGGSLSKSAPKANVGPGGLFLTSGVLLAASQGAIGPSGSATSQASVAGLDLLGGTLTATSVAGTCTANETGASGSATLTGAMLVLELGNIVALPGKPAPNTSYEGKNSQTGDTFTVVLNEQVATPGGLTVNAVHVILHGPTATGDIVVASTQSGATVKAP